LKTNTNTEPLRRGGGEFQPGHPQRSVAHDAHHLRLRASELRPDGRRHAVPHAVEIGRRQEASRTEHGHQLGSQKRRVAVVDDPGRIVGELAAQRVEEHDRIDAATQVVREPFPATGAPVRGDPRSHGGAPRPVGRALREFDRGLLQHPARVAFERPPGRVIRAEHARVDVEVEEIRRRIPAEAAGGDFAEARADGQQAIAVTERVFDGGHCGAPETESGMQRAVGGECAEPLQRRAHRGPEPLGDRRALA